MGEEEEFANLPLPDQFQHKNWKARKGGYETATKEFRTAQPTDPIVREFILESGLWKAAVSDSNVAAQQEALGAYNAFLEASGTEGARKTRSNTVGGIVEKGLTGRPAAKTAAMESLLLLIELDKPDPIIEEILPYLSHKMPKLITAALSALTNIYHAYGCKTVEPKPVIKLLPKVFAHADKNVRAEAQNLTVELYRWLREAMKPLFWGELKEVQQKDLDKLFEPVKAEPQPKQERLLRSQQAAVEAAAAAGDTGEDGEEGGEGEGEEDAGIDLEPEFEAVDVLAKVPKDFTDRLASSKWKDRKEALDELYAAVNVPAIQEGQFDDLIRGCAKSMKDANIAVVTVAANCVECIAKGLRKAFSRYKGTILSPMLERFKEKKASVTDAIAAACDAVFMSTSLSDIQPEVLEALKNKNPQIKEHSAKFLIRCLKTTRDAPSLEQTKELSEAGKKLLSESVASLRDAGAEILGVLWKIMTDRNMLNHLDGLDDIRKNKIKEFSDAAEVKAKWKPKAAPPPKAAAAPAGKKPAPGGRRPAPGVKKPAAPAKAASPPPTEDPGELKPRATSRPGAKPGGIKPPGSGLKGPSGLAKPGSGLKAPGAGTASPKRQGAVMDEAPPAVPKPAGLGGPGRGLAGRPLGKPATAAAAPPSPSRNVSSSEDQPAPSSSNSNGLSSIERQELHDLRAELDLLRNQTSDLRQDKMKLSSQLAELQVQNAQLIEDHTRDVLQIKAKETQLTRARSDAEAADERAGSLGREVERMKREMSRLGRNGGGGAGGMMGGAGVGGAMSPPLEVPAGFGSFPASSVPDDRGSFGGGAGGNGIRPAYGSSRSYNPPSSSSRHGSFGLGGSGSADGLAADADSEAGKENIPSSASASADDGLGGGAQPPKGFNLASPRQQYAASRPISNGGYSSGRATPLSSAAEGGGRGSGEGIRPSGTLERGGSGSHQSDGVESWRRAAEVTQNLKARIEMMKARQNLSRGQ
ncbi:ARM repeat-containing protein [Hortaea werneckii]|nr:ARM repeat-containing protein [Hortaea werneckii]KAI7102145.1 ARM repeat-containing protein [Hortaea werneckii]KAI7218703.1 ARM repeat-containing protein [Hortaea werneckii]KAI7313661.1 ARM repeat-containing protein [Hortaea werneckii]KAI7395832.1 ARM repeat-containing protein [Hortaea werneckii]